MAGRELDSELVVEVNTEKVETTTGVDISNDRV